MDAVRGILLVMAFTHCVLTEDGRYLTGSVYCEGRSCRYHEGETDFEGATAFGGFNDTLLQTGWGILDIVAGHGAQATDDEIMFAAGYLEGILTQKHIHNHYLNLKADHLSTISVSGLKKFLDEQDQWMREMIEQNSPQDPMWRHVGLVIAQFDGMVSGYQHAAPSDKSSPEEMEASFPFQFLNALGDTIELKYVVQTFRAQRPDFRKMSEKQFKSFVLENGHCSALTKVLGGYEDILMSHNSWFKYSATNRIFKHYNFNVADSKTAAKRLSFSSYPGLLSSLDDFYMMSSQIVMLQTTNNIFDFDLYQHVTPSSLLAWQRVRVANMMSHSGFEWAKTLSQHNSGTYTNQYMIIDLKKVELSRHIEDGALVVVEQIPGYVEYGDATSVLRTGHFPSYNVPYFENIYNMTGQKKLADRFGMDYSYQLSPRAKIFRRDAGRITDMKDMKKLMRSNDYKHDLYSNDDPCDAICCRGDLRSTSAFGCYDAKVTDYKMALELTAEIVSGPTAGTGLPHFEWSSEFPQSHLGLPKKYNFHFITTSPRWKHYT